ncbi:hypothetical protein EVAR_71448_1, partial [Eumeta japonica]
ERKGLIRPMMIHKANCGLSLTIDNATQHVKHQAVLSLAECEFAFYSVFELNSNLGLEVELARNKRIEVSRQQRTPKNDIRSWSVGHGSDSGYARV